MGPFALLLFGGATLLAWLDHRKPVSRLIVWSADGGYTLTQAWWGHMGDDLAYTLQRYDPRSPPEHMDPRVLAWHVLQGHVPDRVGGRPPEPYASDGADWQTGDSSVAGYWGGSPAVLDLLDVTTQAVSDALPYWHRTGEVTIQTGHAQD